jgi:hypothetical protein
MTKSNNFFAYLEKKLKPKHNFILLNIKNDGPFLAFSLVLKFSQTYQILLGTYLIVSSFKVTKKIKYKPPNLAISLGTTFFLHAYTQAYSTPYVYHST